jgi:hypothetical protein
MSDPKEAEEFAAKVLATMGPAETLLMSMRLLLLVGQKDPENAKVVAAAQEAVAAIKRLGEATGVFKVAN